MKKRICKTIYCIGIILLTSITARAAGLDDLFNSNVLISRSGTSVTMSNVAVADGVYKGTWTMDEQFNMNITNIEREDQGASFDSAQAWQVLRNSTETDGTDAGLSRFSNLQGCESFSSYEFGGFTFYTCKGPNFLRILGGINSNAMLEYDNFDMPLYMTDGSVKTMAVSSHITSALGTTDFTTYVNMAMFDTGDTWTGLLHTFTQTKYSAKYLVFKKGTYEVVEAHQAFDNWPED